MKELQIFNNEEFGEIRTVEINGEPWFIGKDITERLKYQNGSRDIDRHVDEEDKQIISVFDGTQNRNTIVINESGLYALILNSKLPHAKKFKRWVTSEVLPTIRRTGGYNLPQTYSEALRALADKAEEAERLRLENKEMQPKADYFDALVDRNLLTNFRDTAKEFGIGQNRLVTILLDKKFIYRDANNKLKPYSVFAKGENKLFEVKEYSSHYSEHVGIQTLITPRGRETFRLLLQKA